MDAQHQVTDAVCRLLDKDGSQSAKKTCRDAEQQHELLVRQMCLAPVVESLNPIADFLFRHDNRSFSAANLEKTLKQKEKTFKNSVSSQTNQ